MSRVDEMRELTAELAANHADRRQALDNMSREVNLERVAAAMAHAAMAAEQRATLTADRMNRHQAVEAMRADLNLVHAAMAAEQKATLTADRAALHQAVDALLAGLNVVHAAMAAEQKATLTADRANRRQTVDALHAAMAAEQKATLTADRAALRQTVDALLADLAAEHAAMATEQKATLTADRAALRQAMDALLADLAVVHAAMATEQKATLTADRVNRHQTVATERTDLRRSLNQMAQVWLEFAAAMHGNTVAAQPEPAPPVPLATEPATEEVLLPAEDVDDRLLAYLAEHAEGVKLVELEPVFELSRPQLGRHLRALVDSDKVVKDSETLIYKLA